MSKIQYQKLFLAVDVISIIIILGMLVYTFNSILKMPDTIPIHSTDGEVDGWGSKWTVMVLPGLAILVYAFFNFFTNYLAKRNELSSMIITKFSGLVCVIMFLVINLSFIQFALS